MKVEFITQPDTRTGDILHHAIEQRGVPSELVIVSAFASLTAVSRIKPIVKSVKDAHGDVRLVLGVDLGGTSKEVLAEVESWGISITIVKNKAFGVTFHPKIYFLRWLDYAEIIIGSSNLTDGGLYRNYEASSRNIYELPQDQSELDYAVDSLTKFLKPAGAVSATLNAEYLQVLLSLPEIPSEAKARKARREGIPVHPPSNAFGFELIPFAPTIKKPTSQSEPTEISAEQVAKKKLIATTKNDSFAIQVRAHHNGEIFLSVTAALQNPSFFRWPFNGSTTPKKAGKPPYPQLVPDPVVDIVVYGKDLKPIMTLAGYPLNTVYYEAKSEIRVTASPLVPIMPDNSIMIMRRSDAIDRDYEIAVHIPASPEYEFWLKACDQKMPGGGKEPRRFGWF